MQTPGLKGREEIHLQPATGAAKRGTALLFHGMTGTPSEMAGLAEFLSRQGFEVFVPCHAGHGLDVNELKVTPSSVWLDAVTTAAEKFPLPGGEPLYVAGLSFGALLACYFAEEYPDRVKKLALLSIPLRLSSSVKELGLALISRLPEQLLNFFPVMPKSKRPPGYLVLEHNAFKVHSVGAVARLVKIRRKVISKLSRIKADILILQDPGDHHLAPDVPELLQAKFSPAQVKVEWLPGGQHELTLGAQHENVNRLIFNFFTETK